MPRLRRETRSFKRHAINSLILAIESFNRPHNISRNESVLFFLQHSFEMLLKAAIFQTRGTIWEPRSPITYRFDKCLGIARSEIGILTEDTANTLSMLDGFRDCAMHNLLEMSEECLYLQSQAAVTIFDDILNRVFGERLADYLPERILPISTKPPEEIQLFIDKEFSQIKDLIMPGKRHGAEAKARIRPYLIMESVLEGKNEQPTNRQAIKTISRIRNGYDWRAVFPGVATLKLDTTSHGLTFSVRFTRQRDAPPVHVVRNGEDVTGATLVREVNLIDRYSMGLYDLADKLGLARVKTLALIQHLNLQSDPECFREFQHRSMKYKGYSPKALEKLKDALSKVDIEHVWLNSPLRQKLRKRKED